MIQDAFSESLERYDLIRTLLFLPRESLSREKTASTSVDIFEAIANFHCEQRYAEDAFYGDQIPAVIEEKQLSLLDLKLFCKIVRPYVDHMIFSEQRLQVISSFLREDSNDWRKLHRQVQFIVSASLYQGTKEENDIIKTTIKVLEIFTKCREPLRSVLMKNAYAHYTFETPCFERYRILEQELQKLNS